MPPSEEGDLSLDAPTCLPPAMSVASRSGRLLAPEVVGSYLSAAAGAGRRLAVLHEDIRWADPTSQALLAQVAEEVRREPILRLLTYRPDEDAAGSSLAGLRRELARERLAEEIVLR